jgi:hypothetical protein
MGLGPEEKIKLMDKYIEILKQDLLSLMTERKPESENMVSHKIVTIKQELDRVVQEKMRQRQVCHSNVSNRVDLSAASA